MESRSARSSTTGVRVATMNRPFLMSKTVKIKRISPAAAIPGGEIAIEFVASVASDDALRVFIDGVEAHVIAASPARMLVSVPLNVAGGEVEVSVEPNQGKTSKGAA